MIDQPKIRVLLVDDEAEFVETLSIRLAGRGLDIDFALDGQEVERLVEVNAYDVVILDVCMPEKNGIEVLAEIKKKSPATAVIMLTGHAEMDMSIKGLSIGADDYLIKPVRIESLLEKIEMAYQRRLLKLEKDRNE